MPVGTTPITWQQFSVLFLEMYVMYSRKEELCRHFERLRQDNMTVTLYEMRFFELAHHAIWLAPIHRERIKRFIDGLTFQLQALMTRERVSGATFDEVVDIARDRVGPQHAQTAHPVHRGASSSHGSHSSQQGHSSPSALPAQRPSSGYPGARGPFSPHRQWPVEVRPVLSEEEKKRFERFKKYFSPTFSDAVPEDAQGILD
uniref:Uncharacterized protein LOC104214564 n=1 Tax=Nicotiana sylvestris TaxID=4096 RepID=A0A1U7V852_NICSY|nr:PREDICTED: uncharacterized protein LOC104214564 [Nicotiana sylvestris]